MAYIYKIENTVNGKFYIGSTINFDKRRYTHLYQLKRNIHPNKYLQNAWNKYGEESFQFNVLEEVDDSEQFDVEQEYLNELKPFGDKGYNMLKSTNSTKYRWYFTIECGECGLLFLREKRDQRYCTLDCDDLATDNEWLRSRYELKNIRDWSVDDHLAAHFDDRWDK